MVGRTPDHIWPPAIGRVKTVIVFDNVGVVSEIIARAFSSKKADRLDFRGPVNFKAETKHHLTSFVLPIVDRITDNLNIPEANYEISLVNLGAAASSDIGVEITGFSADLPILLALLSVSLKVPIRQDIVCTGHVASIEGDLATVRCIPEKLEAALTSPEISVFVFPDLERDKSLQALTPIEYQATKKSLLQQKDNIKIFPVGGAHDAARIAMTDESIVFGSLKAGFYDIKTADLGLEGPVKKAVVLLAEGNEKRFWDVLGHSFLNGALQKAKQLIQVYVDFHIENQLYPEKFGERLYLQVISLPPSIRKLDDFFPLVPMEFYIKLTQYAKQSDHEDVKHFSKAVFEDGFGRQPYQTASEKEIKSDGRETEDELIRRLLNELSQENLAVKIGLPLDEARFSYAMEKATVKDGSEFNGAVTAFFVHMIRHTGSLVGQIRKDTFSVEAIDLLTKAFENKGGYKAAFSEGIQGINGGMRLIFDTMTEHLKLVQKEKYIFKVFKDIIDPLDWDAKVRLMEVFMERIELELPSDLRGLSAKRLASQWNTIIRYYVESMDKVSDLIRRL